MADFLQRLAFLVFTALASHAQAQSATTSSIASNATIAPGSNSFNYLGCYNETTGIADAGNVRALGEKGNVVRDWLSSIMPCLVPFLKSGPRFPGLFPLGLRRSGFARCSLSLSRRQTMA